MSRFWVYFFVLIYCSVFPFAYVYCEYINTKNPFKHKYVWLLFMYIVMMNMLIVRLIGRYIISAIAYPFSNVCASKYLKKNLNAKFGGEFAKRIEHMSLLLKSFSAQGSKMSPEMLPQNSLAHQSSFVDSDGGGNDVNTNMF